MYSRFQTLEDFAFTYSRTSEKGAGRVHVQSREHNSFFQTSYLVTYSADHNQLWQTLLDFYLDILP